MSDGNDLDGRELIEKFVAELERLDLEITLPREEVSYREACSPEDECYAECCDLRSAEIDALFAIRNLIKPMARMLRVLLSEHLQAYHYIHRNVCSEDYPCILDHVGEVLKDELGPDSEKGDL